MPQFNRTRINVWVLLSLMHSQCPWVGFSAFIQYAYTVSHANTAADESPRYLAAAARTERANADPRPWQPERIHRHKTMQGSWKLVLELPELHHQYRCLLVKMVEIHLIKMLNTHSWIILHQNISNWLQCRQIAEAIELPVFPFSKMFPVILRSLW